MHFHFRSTLPIISVEETISSQEDGVIGLTDFAWMPN
jgi:hypothetical protein